MIKSVGITGSRHGMTDVQALAVYNILCDILAEHSNTLIEFHHGDCVGADVQAATFAHELGYRTACHPPKESVYRAYHHSAILFEEDDYLPRDRAIVDSVDFLIVAPNSYEPVKNSGTWYTHDYAEKKNVPRYIVFPNGDISYD